MILGRNSDFWYHIVLHYLPLTPNLEIGRFSVLNENGSVLNKGHMRAPRINTLTPLLSLSLEQFLSWNPVYKT